MVDIPVTTEDIKEKYEIIGPVFFQISNKGIFLTTIKTYSKKYATEIKNLRDSGKMDPVIGDVGALWGEPSVGQGYFEQAFYIATQELKRKAALLGANAVIGMRMDIDLDTNGFQYFYLQMYGTAVKMINEEDENRYRIEKKKKEILQKMEIEKLRQEEAEKEALEKQEKSERAAALEEKLKSCQDDPKVIAFLKDISEADRYMELLNSWNDSGLNSEVVYEELSEEIKSRAEIERLYGPGANTEKPEDYIKKIFEFFRANKE